MERKEIKKITYEAEGCNFKVCVEQENNHSDEVKFYFVSPNGESICFARYKSFPKYIITGPDFQTMPGDPVDITGIEITKRVEDIFKEYGGKIFNWDKLDEARKYEYGNKN